MPKSFFPVRHWFFLLLLVFGQSSLGFGQDEGDNYDHEESNRPPSFTAVNSVIFRPGTDYIVFFTVNPHPKKEPLQFKCILMSNSNWSTTIQSDPISLRPGESGHISIPMPREMPGNETVWRLFAWSFTNKSAAEDYKWQAPHSLVYSSQTNTDDQSLQAVFIQTNKPAYKPDDLVRIRVITMDSNDLPHLTAGVNMTITDSQGNVMKKWEQPLELPPFASQPSNVSSNENLALFGEFQKKKNGLSSYEYQLSSEPILGNWTIQVEAGNIKEKMYFDVQKYILPKFQVNVKVPSVLYGSGVISAAATIKASYTSGKGLHGTGNVTVTSSNDGLTKVHQIVVKDGEDTILISLSSPRSLSTVHTITANVTEQNTGRWQTGKATVRIYAQETYFVQWINKPSSYKPGLPITVQLKITGADGFPVHNVRQNSLRITFPSSFYLPPKETSIPPSGIVTFTFPTPLQPLPDNSRFDVQYKRSTFDFTLPTAERGTSSGIFIQIVSPPDTPNFIQGRSYNFTIRSNKPIQPDVFHYLLWDDAAMEVHGAQTIVNNQKEPATEFPFSLQIPKAAYTGLKIFVYFETQNDQETTEIISTFKSINTGNFLKIRVSRPIPKKAPALVPAREVPVETTTQDNIYVYDSDDGLGVTDEEPQPEISDKLQVEPGDAVEIHFETDPDSTIAIRGVDQSLFLLPQQNQDNDLNQEAVERKRAYFPSHFFQLANIPTETSTGKTKYCSGDNSCSLKAFHRLGISVLSSDRHEPFRGLHHLLINSWEESELVASENELLDETRIPQIDSRLPVKFPETWLWEEFQISSNSTTTTLSKILPDTLTSWIISGFSLNPHFGLGVASPASITGFMPFFVTLNFPYSVVKYETFELQVIVHNHLDRDVNVWINLFNRHNDFDFIDSREIGRVNATRYIKVSKSHFAVARFVITARVIGDIPIEVKAVTEDGDAGDSMIRPLKVKPDGVRQTRSQMIFFEATNGDKNLSREHIFDVQFPRKTVKGGSSLQLTVIDDPMGTMISNLGNLLRIPHGGGEQNMIVFVPNILALHYLKATNSDAMETIQRATRLLEQGYGQQLQYKKRDGSFAVWQQDAGSTWLTAYVAQWFIAAQKYITVDPNVIKGAVNFIRSKQQTYGSFIETGGFYHPKMQGQNGTEGVALTAYITLALIKANERSTSDLDLKKAIENGMNFISKGSVYQLDDNYITNLVAATLTAGNHPEKNRFFEKMEEAATVTTTTGGVNVKYWDTINARERASGPLAIEMTSYALLAHLWRSGRTDSSAVDIHRWLLIQRNSNGGFTSTQDTVMGLTALTAYALKTKGNFRDEDELQLNIRASSLSKFSRTRYIVNDTELSASVNRGNRMVLQEFNLPISTTNITLHAKGGGPALIQMTESWYAPISRRQPRYPQDFNITANMTIPDPEMPSEAELRLCVNSIYWSGARDSIASVQLPSGYAFEQEDFENGSEFMAEMPENVKRFELTEGNSKLEVYFSYIQAYTPTCITLVATRLNEVAGGKRVPIVVYEYLNPEVKGIVTYEPAHRINICQLCHSTGACDREGCQ